MWPKVQRWRGVILIGIAVVASLWLGFGNQLVLYIHPRYIIFTVVMGALALALVVASILVTPSSNHEDEPRPGAQVLSWIALAVAGLIAAAMVILPPATLTSATASQRDINSTSLGAPAQSVTDAETAPTAVFATFTVVDWSSLLRQTSDLSFYDGKPVDVTGFVTADSDDPQNVFYVSRFVVTCCAVDAQPTGVPVYLPNWAETLTIHQWVRVTGEFGTNASRESKQGIVLKPIDVTIVEQPSEPYLY